jgi:hypothetical protein
MATTDGSPPDVRVPDGWERTSSTTETMFDAKVVTVRAHTVVLEDRRLRATVRDRTGADETWRFFFASRLALRPKTGRSKALTRLVTDRANEGFVEQLRERGFADVESVEKRRFAVGRTEADLTRYRARVEATTGASDPASTDPPASDGESGESADAVADGGETVRVTAEGYLAVWPDDDGGYLLAGGAYPLSVEDEAVDRTLASLVTPEQHRGQLFELIRSVE